MADIPDHHLSPNTATIETAQSTVNQVRWSCLGRFSGISARASNTPVSEGEQITDRVLYIDGCFSIK
jgi:hypothetical protein